MIEKTIVRDLSATLHTERLSWPGMSFLCGFTIQKAISLTYRCLVIENVHDTTILS